MRKIFVVLFGIICALPAFAQDTTATHKIYRHKHFSTLNNDGYGLMFEMGRQQSLKKSLLFQLEITERKSAKEEKQLNPAVIGSSFIYGKENYFYPVKLGVQQQITLGN